MLGSRQGGKGQGGGERVKGGKIRVDGRMYGEGERGVYRRGGLAREQGGWSLEAGG